MHDNGVVAINSDKEIQCDVCRPNTYDTITVFVLPFETKIVDRD